MAKKDETEIKAKPNTDGLTQKARDIINYVKKHGGKALRKDIAKDLGKSYGPMCYALKDRGLLKKNVTPEGMEFQLVKKK